jgi:hypothetical protein
MHMCLISETFDLLVNVQIGMITSSCIYMVTLQCVHTSCDIMVFPTLPSYDLYVLAKS